MIDYQTAKAIVEKQYLPILARSLGTPVTILDEETEECEWGWLICWDTVDRTQIKPERRTDKGQMPILVERTLGLSSGPSTSSLKFEIQSLLERRDKKLAEMQRQG